MELALTSTHGVQRDELGELLERDRGRLVRIAWQILGADSTFGASRSGFERCI